MSETQTMIRFPSLHKLWQFAQRIKCTSMQINTLDKTLLCNCSEQDLALVPVYKGEIVDVKKVQFNSNEHL
jgi:hypothetical protein